MKTSILSPYIERKEKCDCAMCQPTNPKNILNKKSPGGDK